MNDRGRLTAGIQRYSDMCMDSFWFFLCAFFLFWEPDYIKSVVRPLDRLFDAGSLLFLLLLTVFYIVRIREVFVSSKTANGNMPSLIIFSRFFVTSSCDSPVFRASALMSMYSAFPTRDA